MDVYVDRARLAGVVVAPHPLEELVTAHDLARMAKEERQELEDLWLERHLAAVAKHAVAGDVDLDRADRHAGRQGRHKGFAAAGHGPEACRGLAGPEWLRHVFLAPDP